MSGKPTRGFWPMRDLPVAGWLIAAVIVGLLRPVVPAPRWLLLHLVLLGAATHSILVWSRYFADALLHTPPDPSDRARQNRRLLLLNLGVLLVVTGVLTVHWPVTVVGGTAVGIAAAWHGAALLRQLRSALPARFAVTVRYYVAAAALLPVGVTLGVALARVQSDPWHQRLLVAHASTNLLGWIGLAALGTLLTLWPTMLRTRIAVGAERSSGRALPVLLLGIVLAVAGPVTDSYVLAALGWLIYAVGIGLLAPRLRGGGPGSTSSILPYVLGRRGNALAARMPGCPRGRNPRRRIVVGRQGRLAWFTPFLAVGFGAQLLLGAMSYLVPVARGGGPGPVRAATAVFNRAGLRRVVATNAALLVCVLPMPPAVRVLCSAVAFLGLASFLPLLVLALRASRAARTGGRTSPAPAAPEPSRLRRQGAAALAVVMVAALIGAGIDRSGLDWFREEPVAAGATPTGHTTVVEVEARDMRFHPFSIAVPAGDRLVIALTSTGTRDVHDLVLVLVLDDGSDTDRLSPGDSARLEAGVVGRNIAGWCSIIGHRQMGMVLTVTVIGTTPSAGLRRQASH